MKVSKIVKVQLSTFHGNPAFSIAGIAYKAILMQLNLNNPDSTAMVLNIVQWCISKIKVNFCDESLTFTGNPRDQACGQKSS